MKKIALLGILFILLMTNLGFARGSKWGGMNFPHYKFWQLPEVSEKLKLTAEEKSQLESLFFQNKGQMIDLRSMMEKESLNLEQLMSSKALDESAVMNQFKKVQDALTQLGMERFKFVLEVRKILGPDRFEELRGIFKETRMNRQGGRFGQWQEGSGRGQSPEDDLPEASMQ